MDGTPLKDLTHVVAVKELPAPSVDFKRKPNTNDLTLEVVTYGKSNAVAQLFPIGGIRMVVRCTYEFQAGTP